MRRRSSAGRRRAANGSHARDAATVAQLAESTLRQYLAEASAAAVALRRTPGGKALHDYRVSLRRFRRAVRVFAPAADGSAGGGSLQLPARLRSLLSAARDGSVWLAQVERWCARDGRGGPRDLRYLHGLRCSLRRRQAALGRAVAAGRLSSALAAVERSMPRILARVAEPGEDAAAFAARTLRRALRRLARQTVDIVRPDDWHALRRRVRRTRYLAEFLAPHLAPSGARIEEELHRASDALGTVHDMDVAAACLARERPAAPGWVGRRVRRARARAVRRFRKCWKRIRRMARRRRIRAAELTASARRA